MMGDQDEDSFSTKHDVRVIQVRKGESNSSSLHVLTDSIEEGNKHVREEIGKNTRAIRCLQKAVREQTNAIQAQTEADKIRTQTLKDIKEEIHQFVLYYRGYIRKERHKEEKHQSATFKRKRSPSPEKENVLKSVVKRVPRKKVTTISKLQIRSVFI